LAGDDVSTSTTLARSTVHQLLELGISDVVISPGSRNAPLSIAFYEAEARGLINLHVRVDERGAAFFALGIAKATGRYVPVVCTSGTAVANLLPAVMEAHHSYCKLLLLTADRPERLRRTGSNQTTYQNGIFGDFVSTSIDTPAPIEFAPILAQGGPIHINLQFDEPLLPHDDGEWHLAIHPKVIPTSSRIPSELLLTTSKHLVIVGHDRAGFSVAEIERFADQIGAPILAEDPLVFERSVAHAPIVLSDSRVSSQLKPDLAVVIGRTTLSRTTNRYINGIEDVLVVDPRTERIDTERRSKRIETQLPTVRRKIGKNLDWFASWQRYESAAEEAVACLPEWCEARALAMIAQELPTDTALFISSSRPIRDIESFAMPRSGLTTYANRGLAGIDGNISTAMGIATFHEETYAVIGDLAFIHDLSALAQPTKDPLTVIVIDNDGGGIFSTLPQRGIDGFERIFGTPHGQDLAKIVSGFGISHEVVKSTKELQIALRRVHPFLHIIIAKMPDREFNADALLAVTRKFQELVTL
jgi:2-succinyl-5-enolpyruvyl-6-hydroxy-3-cyclohexene-1-carboxylate synthase